MKTPLIGFYFWIFIGYRILGLHNFLFNCLSLRWDLDIYIYKIKSRLTPAILPAHSPAKVKDLCNHGWLVYMGRLLYVRFVHRPVHALVGARNLPGVSFYISLCTGWISWYESSIFSCLLLPVLGFCHHAQSPTPCWGSEIQMLVRLLIQ